MRRAVILTLLSACAVRESDTLDTSEIWARYQVVHDDADTVVAQAFLTAGGPTGPQVDLTGGDRMEIEGEPMTEWTDSVTDLHWNRAIVEATPDAAYQIVLFRPATDEAIATTVNTPAEPAILGTAPADLVARGEALTVTWDASEPADGVEVRVEGDCVLEVQVTNVPDTGTFTTEPLQDGGIAGDCEIIVRVIRGFTRGVSADFGGGWSETYRADSIVMSYDALGG